jgi:trafficking protein particle complex subunit 10
MVQKPILTYTEEGSLWEGIKDEFLHRFPIRNLNLVLRGEQQTIPSLDLEFRKYQPDMFPKFVPGALQYNSFFVHIFLLASEDVEAYKSSAKKMMQDWWNVVATKKNQEWLIICVSGGQVPKSRKFLLGGSNATVYERIKSDLNIKKDRIFQVGMSMTDGKNLEAWNDLIIRIKECVITGVTSQISQYEEDSRRLEHQRMVPGWNYCQYFIMKEALSLTFEMLTLYRDALVHYDELEATFYQTLEEQGAPWFKKFGGTEHADDNQDVFKLSNKNYRDLIIQNGISIFDFRMYLFSRQIALLAIQKSPIEICRRSNLFISSFSRTLYEYRVFFFDLGVFNSLF